MPPDNNTYITTLQRLHIVLKAGCNLLRSAMTFALIFAAMLMKVLYLWSSVTLLLECCVPLHMGHLLWLLSLNRRSTQLRQTRCWHGNTLGTLSPYFSRQIGHDVSSTSASVSVTFTTGVDSVLVAMTIDWRIHNNLFCFENRNRYLLTELFLLIRVVGRSVVIDSVAAVVPLYTISIFCSSNIAKLTKEGAGLQMKSTSNENANLCLRLHQQPISAWWVPLMDLFFNSQTIRRQVRLRR